MDITTDGLGFMLSVGHLAWVPFSYSLQARYLAFNHVELGPFWTCAIFMLHAFGYWVFRDSNNEKNDFRNGKNPKSEFSLVQSGGRTEILIQHCRIEVITNGARDETVNFRMVGYLPAS